MNWTLFLIFAVIFVIFVLQALGTYLQVKSFQKSIRRVHQYGNVGMGQKRGLFTPGYLVSIACDNEGVITYGESLTGLTVFSKPKPFHQMVGLPLEGTHIDDFMDEFRLMTKNQFRKNRGYIQAIDALERRIYPERFNPEEFPVLTLDSIQSRTKEPYKKPEEAAADSAVEEVANIEMAEEAAPEDNSMTSAADISENPVNSEEA